MTDRDRFYEWYVKESKILTNDEFSLAWEIWQAARRWIPVSEDMPKNDTIVLAYGYNNYGPLCKIRAVYISKYTIKYDNEFDEVDVDFCDEDETPYVPEGWYEWNETEETHWMVEFEILGWQPLPGTPEEE